MGRSRPRSVQSTVQTAEHLVDSNGFLDNPEVDDPEAKTIPKGHGGVATDKVTSLRIRLDLVLLLDRHFG
jgi:hypothetical protein